MIRRRPEWKDGIDNVNPYDGPERRSNTPSDRRTTVYNNYETQLIDRPEEKKPAPVVSPWLMQLIVILGTVGSSTLGIYLSLHDEQLTQKSNFQHFEERYKEDQQRHNETHNKIYQQTDKLTLQAQALEETMTQALTRRNR